MEPPSSILPYTLDFFVVLSSAVGVVRNSSQANHGAGPSFLDALANHRRSIGLPALSLDLGIIASVGYVSENDEVRKQLNRMGHDTISEDSTSHKAGRNSLGSGRSWRYTKYSREATTIFPATTLYSAPDCTVGKKFDVK
ncbi:hypothetical protein BJX99DRAFT_263063 [Aspergillus californicus]